MAVLSLCHITHVKAESHVQCYCEYFRQFKFEINGLSLQQWKDEHSQNVFNNEPELFAILLCGR
jgi:hypothetical protein